MGRGVGVGASVALGEGVTVTEGVRVGVAAGIVRVGLGSVGTGVGKMIRTGGVAEGSGVVPTMLGPTRSVGVTLVAPERDSSTGTITMMVMIMPQIRDARETPTAPPTMTASLDLMVHLTEYLQV